MAGPANTPHAAPLQTPPSTADGGEDGAFDFELPADRIAQHPAQRREDARLLHVRHVRADGLADLRIPDLLHLLEPGSVLVLNDTRVIKARLHGFKSSGGRVELLVERIVSERRALALLRTSHAPRPGLQLQGAAPGGEAAAWRATVLGREEDLFSLEFDRPVAALLESAGEVPLPPYIRHAPEANDEARYQTVYARAPGAVAAPTAGLHLSEALLGQLQARGVELASLTLHVGAGTFQPLRSARLDEHRMHAERYEIPPATAAIVNAARNEGRPIVAVGTTSVRALESGMHDGQLQPGSGETRLFIRPGFAFRCVDRLLTNFHLPGSTLILLVAAFAGTQTMRAAYAHAIAAGYRFYSYGDAMLLERA